MNIIIHQIVFWLHWGIVLLMAAGLAVMLFQETDRGVRMTAAMLLVPVVLRLLLIK